MVSLTALWLPILLSAVAVFLASWLLHMLLTYHRSDYHKLPNEEKLLEAMRAASVTPGSYYFPYAPSHKEMGSPEMQEKYKRGPVGLINILPSRPPAMGKYLGQWFVFCLVVSVFAAYVAGRALGPGAQYLAVFRMAGTAAFLAYALGETTSSIWKGQPWGATLKHMFDGLIYALLTAGFFGWQWPH